MTFSLHLPPPISEQVLATIILATVNNKKIVAQRKVDHPNAWFIATTLMMLHVNGLEDVVAIQYQA